MLRSGSIHEREAVLSTLAGTERSRHWYSQPDGGLEPTPTFGPRERPGSESRDARTFVTELRLVPPGYWSSIFSGLMAPLIPCAVLAGLGGDRIVRPFDGCEERLTLASAHQIAGCDCRQSKGDNRTLMGRRERQGGKCPERRGGECWGHEVAILRGGCGTGSDHAKTRRMNGQRAAMMPIHSGIESRSPMRQPRAGLRYSLPVMSMDTLTSSVVARAPR